MTTRLFANNKKVYQPGDILPYRLRATQYPLDPDKIWHGRVEMVLVNIYDRSQRRYYLVTILHDGFEGEEELIYPDQIVS